MSKKILLSCYNNRHLAILLENDNPIEIFAEHLASPALVGNIYLGIVVRVLSNGKMAFVDIGEARTALLHFYDCHKLPRQGEKILVQVIKEPLGDKGARLSTKICLISQNLIYLPTQQHGISVSKKINDLKIKEHLIHQLKDKCQGGVIVRTNAQFCDDLGNEMTKLNDLWQKILYQKQADYAKRQPKRLYQELPLFLRFVRDKADYGCQVIVETDDIVKQVQSHFSNVLVIANPHLFEEFCIKQLIENALSSKIMLPSGGFIVIDEVEAMSVIDVNAGTSNHGGKTNLEAVQAIAQAIRLKNLGGIIVIDFIDTSKLMREEIIQNLKLATKNDSMSVKIYEFSRLGLLEMTRERSFLTLTKQLAGWRND